MEKWICTVCGYVYDPDVGDPTSGIPPARHSPIYRTIGSARTAAWARTCSNRSRRREGCLGGAIRGGRGVRGERNETDRVETGRYKCPRPSLTLGKKTTGRSPSGSARGLLLTIPLQRMVFAILVRNVVPNTKNHNSVLHKL